MKTGDKFELIRNGYEVEIDCLATGKRRFTLPGNDEGEIALVKNLSSGGGIKEPKFITNTSPGVTGTTVLSYTLRVEDAAKCIVCRATNPINIRIPNDTTFNIPIDKGEIDIIWDGSGAVSVSRSDGNIAYLGEGGNITTRTIIGRYMAMTIKKLEANYWYAIGAFSY